MFNRVNFIKSPIYFGGEIINDKKLIAICLLIIFAVAAISGAVVFLNKKTSTTLIEDSDSTFTIGNKYSVSLIDADGNKLANRTINLAFTDSDGNTEYYDVSTNEKGVAKLKIDLPKGNYSVNASFGGDDKFKASSFTQNIRVKNKPQEKTSSSSVATSGKTITPSYEYEKYDGEYKMFTDERDGELFTDVLSWDENAGCYHW